MTTQHHQLQLLQTLLDNLNQELESVSTRLIPSCIQTYNTLFLLPRVFSVTGVVH
jgi:hypothetical protein